MSPRWLVRTTLVLACVALVVGVAGCSSSSTKATTATTAVETSTTRNLGPRAAACARWRAIVENVSLSDAESAQQLNALSNEVDDPELRSAITHMAQLFAVHASNIPSNDIQALCF
jgi:hypothetical protein